MPFLFAEKTCGRLRALLLPAPLLPPPQAASLVATSMNQATLSRCPAATACSSGVSPFLFCACSGDGHSPESARKALQHRGCPRQEAGAQAFPRARTPARAPVCGGKTQKVRRAGNRAVGAGVVQQRQDGGVGRARGKVQGRVPGGGCARDVGPQLDELPDELDVPVLGRDQQRRDLALWLQARRGARASEQARARARARPSAANPRARRGPRRLGRRAVTNGQPPPRCAAST